MAAHCEDDDHCLEYSISLRHSGAVKRLTTLTCFSGCLRENLMLQQTLSKSRLDLTQAQRHQTMTGICVKAFLSFGNSLAKLPVNHFGAAEVGMVHATYLECWWTNSYPRLSRGCVGTFRHRRLLTPCPSQSPRPAPTQDRR